MAQTHSSAERNNGAKQVAGQGPSAAVIKLPERPALARNVRLIGRMPDTGFKQQQWLIQREARFIQVTELLYRLAEEANGERTLEELAERLTDKTDWSIDADIVRQLIQTKFIPLKLIATEDDSAESRGMVGDKVETRSPLAVSLRMKILSPRLINPVTKVLQIFHSPYILIPILVAAAVAHWWLYRVHGLTDSISDVFNTPGGLLAILILVILAGIFHEFGHASALRYGGGEVRAMGAGLYLIYPALFTDVTDSYRLGRWARVRTDLGGIYFHAIFALGLIALSVVTGREFLLFAVLLINLEMVRQLIPFVRLDGYWVLADLTGIPDFFSQMGPFVRSMIPGAKGDKLPNLKPWVGAVFAIYIVGTIPLLAYLFFLMLRGLPRFLGSMWHAFTTQVDMFLVAHSQGELLIMALWGISMLCLALPVVGTLYIVYAVARMSARGIWKFSRPTAKRRLVGAMGTAAIVLLLVFIWIPQQTNVAGLQMTPAQGDSAADPPAADEADRLLRSAREATANLQALQADLEGSLGQDQFTGTIVLKRPNLANIKVKGKGELGEFWIISDGAHRYTFFPEANACAKIAASADGRNIRAYVAKQVEDFFLPENIGVTQPGGSLAYAGRETIDNEEYDVITMESPAPKNGTTRYFISPGDRVIRRVVTTRRRDGGEVVTTSWASLKNIRLNASVDEAVFRWTPPPDVKALQMPEGVRLPVGQSLPK